jgi:hypothetical protein
MNFSSSDCCGQTRRGFRKATARLTGATMPRIGRAAAFATLDNSWHITGRDADSSITLFGASGRSPIIPGTFIAKDCTRSGYFPTR